MTVQEWFLAPLWARAIAECLKLPRRRLPAFDPPLPHIRKRALASGDKKIDQPSGPHGLLRSMLKLIVEIDSSRFLRNRVGAALMLLGLLALFAGIGYGLPALISRYF
jgi:hypothetical protein